MRIRTYTVTAIILSFSLITTAYAEGKIDLNHTILKAEKDKSVLIPWDGNSTSYALVNKLDNKQRNRIIEIIHPENYSLFIDQKLVYQAIEKDTLRLSLDSILYLKDKKSLIFRHEAELFKPENFNITLIPEKTNPDVEYFSTESIPIYKKSIDSNVFLLFFFLIAIIKFGLSREFEFYFSGNFFQTPKLILDKFLGDSISPLLLFFAVLLFGIILFPYSGLERILEITGIAENSNDLIYRLFGILLSVISVISFLVFKRFSYWFFLWVKNDLKNLSGLWRNYLLTFTNLSFWFFLIFSITSFVLPNLDFSKLFQILFFIFAALNAVLGIMAYSFLKIRFDLITLSAVLAIEIFPIVLLIQFLTF